MKYVPDRTGRFAERPHYEAAELDTLFERVVVGFLKSRHNKVEFPISTEDVTVLIEQDSDDLDVYADLSSYAGNVEGVTEFWPGRRPKVRISAHLSEGENRENRFRTTLTHEFGHVKLHGYLFALAPTGPGLFGATAKPDVIACKRDTILSAARTDWMEWQAGYACGAVLMPASYVKQLADAYKRKANLYGPVPVASLHGQALIESLVSTFQVSRDAARVRLSVLGVLGTAPASASLFS